MHGTWSLSPTGAGPVVKLKRKRELAQRRRPVRPAGGELADHGARQRHHGERTRLRRHPAHRRSRRSRTATTTAPVSPTSTTRRCMPSSAQRWAGDRDAEARPGRGCRGHGRGGMGRRPTAQGIRSVGRRRGIQACLVGQHIVWSQFVDLDFSAARIMVTDPNGESRQRLTRPAEGVVDIDPRVSPDGRLVAFERDDADGNGHLMLVGSSTAGPPRGGRRLHDPCFSANGPTWTPDGHHLIFEKVIGPHRRARERAAAFLCEDGPHG